jgi:hypothetical protein
MLAVVFAVAKDRRYLDRPGIRDIPRGCVDLGSCSGAEQTPQWHREDPKTSLGLTRVFSELEDVHRRHRLAIQNDFQQGRGKWVE